tara:strand:- start:644 stop:781 length:138 start_codon:yes stop_codon:yes gene_type:complete
MKRFKRRCEICKNREADFKANTFKIGATVMRGVWICEPCYYEVKE